MYYAVVKGRNIGIYDNWNDCNKQVNGFSNAIYKKFNMKEDASRFISNNRKLIKKQTSLINTKIINKEVNENIGKLTKRNTERINDTIPDYYVYTDGSCHNNGEDNAIAGIGIYFGKKDKRNVSKRISGKQTNNTAELKAIIETYNIIKNDVESGRNITIVSDSKYAIGCSTLYGEKCSKINYMKKGVFIPNKELVQQIYETYKDINNIKFMHCKAHTNKKDIHSLGNDGADKLANNAIKSYISNKIYLNVSFARKEEIKKLGGKWDSRMKKWFIYENNVDKNKILSQFCEEII